MTKRPAVLDFVEVATELCEAVRGFHARGWVLATSGNFSIRLSDEPLRLAMTPSGVHKGEMSPADILQIDADTTVVEGHGRPSAESPLHVRLVRRFGDDAGAVLHTHSIWSTLLSRSCAARGGVALGGLEMLKGLSGVDTHEQHEWLPIVENAQNMDVLGDAMERALDRNAGAHGFLIRGHGLYTWGRDLGAGRRQLEALEFLLEILARELSREG